jgi:hypothetical protein
MVFKILYCVQNIIFLEFSIKTGLLLSFCVMRISPRDEFATS